MSRVETIGDATLYLGDSREIAPTIPGIDAVITSPPYGQQRDYGEKIGDWRSLVSGALRDIQDTGQTQVLVNLGLIHSDGEVISYWDGLIADMRERGWRLFGWYVWDKQNAMAGDWNGRLAPAHEWVFHFNRAPRHPNKVVFCKGAGQLGYKGNSGMRRPDGSLSGWTGMGQPTQQFKIADSVIRMEPQKDRTDPLIRAHPAVFPVSLPLLLADSYSSPGETVLDTFMGSGTTGVACANLDRKFIGIEIDPTFFDISCRRIEEANKQPRLFQSEYKHSKQETFI